MRIIETCPKCGCDLVDMVIYTNPPIPQKICPCCGWDWIGKPEKVIRVPFGGNNYDLNETYKISLNYKASPCETCSNNPRNGGSGVCNCTLGLPKISW